MSQDKVGEFLCDLEGLLDKYWHDDWYYTWDEEEGSIGLSLHTGYMLEDSGIFPKDDCNG